MENIYIEDSLFLCKNKGIQEFVKRYVQNFCLHKKKRWSIICERKEDILPVRKQVFTEIRKILDKENLKSQTFPDISFYSPDDLVSFFCNVFRKHFASSHDSTPYFLNRFYLDLEKQLSIIQMILKFYGYFGEDVHFIAKQILTVIDLDFPNDSDIFSVLLKNEKGDFLEDLSMFNQLSLKVILATLQYAKFLLNTYSRLQNITKDFLQKDFLPYLQENQDKKSLSLLYEFFQGHILWISAPEFSLSQKEEHDFFQAEKILSSSNYQKYFLDEIRETLSKAKKISGFFNNDFLYSQTILSENGNIKNENYHNLQYIIADNRHQYFSMTCNILEDKSYFTLLGEFDLGSFKEIRADAGGTYSLKSIDFQKWKEHDFSYTDSEKIFPKINIFFKKFIEIISLLEIKKLSEIGKIYQIYSFNLEKNAEVMNFFIQTHKGFLVQTNRPHPAVQCSRALFYLDSEKIPEKLAIIGPAHSSKLLSFSARFLNRLFYSLQRQGFQISLYATDIMYRIFWKNLIDSNIKIYFLLENTESLEAFPGFFSQKKNIIKLKNHIDFCPEKIYSSSIFNKIKEENGFFYCRNWFKKYHKEKENCNEFQLSITDFESYVFCPLKFFLTNILEIEKKAQPSLEVDNLVIGSSFHLIAEQFSTRLVTVLGNNYSNNKDFLLVFDKIILYLEQQDVFLSLKKDDWLNIIDLCFKDVCAHNLLFLKEAFYEAIENLWNNEKNSRFISVQQLEILKRVFLRFLKNEKALFAENREFSIQREKNVSIKFENLLLKGKIDRIDKKDNEFYIIDYKVSKIPKEQKSLVLLPSEGKNKESVQLSVQGALYSMAWANEIKSIYSDESCEEEKSIKSFSLFRLKNLNKSSDSILEYKFSPSMKKDDKKFKEISNEYSFFANKLLNGDFSPNPLKKSFCQFCDFKNLCPTGNSESKNFQD